MIRPIDPREHWSLRLPYAASPAPAPSLDTLHVPLHVDSWAALATALDDADVPLQLGDVDVLRQAAKLSPDLVHTLVRWIRTANGPSGPSTHARLTPRQAADQLAATGTPVLPPSPSRLC